ncbi:hypothetical protein C1H46_023750 [Malus baccata]|uniref:Uncharacterized protein n=1 Tax=Malus baccata TaxID=106549 RepID=A0A540LW18_MALBA|nr:hypothetical protein C1H46_023750 [Malus baccata]
MPFQDYLRFGARFPGVGFRSVLQVGWIPPRQLSFGEWAWSGSFACTSRCGSARLVCGCRRPTVRKL